MKFKYSVISDNTQENREWLERVGYKLSGANVGDTLCVCVDGFYQCKNYNLGKTRFQVFLDMLKPVNCIGNSPLFKAVSAMRQGGAEDQYFKATTDISCHMGGFDGTPYFFTIKEGELFEMDEVMIRHVDILGDVRLVDMCVRATLSDLQKHFKKKEI